MGYLIFFLIAVWSWERPWAWQRGWNTSKNVFTEHTVIVQTETYRIRLVFPVVQIMAVVENVLIRGVEAGFDAVFHHLTRPRGALQLLNLCRSIFKHLVPCQMDTNWRAAHSAPAFIRTQVSLSLSLTLTRVHSASLSWNGFSLYRIMLRKHLRLFYRKFWNCLTLHFLVNTEMKVEGGKRSKIYSPSF